MAFTVLAIVEYGAQKQRISLDTNSAYQDLCAQIYSLFKLDSQKSKHSLQRQDPIKPGSFVNVDEYAFMNELKRYTTGNSVAHSVMRLRLVPDHPRTAVGKQRVRPPISYLRIFSRKQPMDSRTVKRHHGRHRRIANRTKAIVLAVYREPALISNN